MGRSVVNSCVFVVSKRRSVVNSNVFHAFAWSKGGNVVNSSVFVCVFGRREDMSKSVVFLCVFARSKMGNVEKCPVFCVFSG